MQFMKRHWFGLVMSLVILAYVSMFMLILASPKIDLQKRGFIPCTEKFIAEAHTCDGSICLLKAVVHNSFCDFSVVGHGFAQWTKGKQPSPWSNYLFVPEIDDINREEMKTIYGIDPNSATDMEKLKNANKELMDSLNKEYSVQEQPKGERFDDATVSEQQIDSDIMEESNADEIVNEQIGDEGIADAY